MTDLFSAVGIRDARMELGLPDPEADWSLYLCGDLKGPGDPGWAVTDEIRLAAGERPELIDMPFGHEFAILRYRKMMWGAYPGEGPEYIVVYDNGTGDFKGIYPWNLGKGSES